MTVVPFDEHRKGLRFKESVGRLGEHVLTAVDQAVTTRWETAQRRAADAAGETVEDRVKSVTRSFARELTALGAAGGAASAAPGVGTVGAVATTAAEFTWFTLRVSDLILTIAVLHGHHRASVEERRAWILSILAFGDTANRGFAKVAQEAGKGLGKKAVNAIPTKSLQAINRALGRTVVTKYGTKRGAVALGRLFPFGIGAALGGGFNYVTVRALARQSDRFFRRLPHSGQSVAA